MPDRFVEVHRGTSRILALAYRYQANNKANGWEMAATLFILNGSSEEQQFHVKETIQSIIDVKKTEHFARLELNAEKGMEEISKEFEQTCMPLAPLQIKAVEVMRRG